MCKKSGRNIRYFSIQVLKAVWNHGCTKVLRYEKDIIRVGAKSRKQAVESVSGIHTVLRVF